MFGLERGEQTLYQSPFRFQNRPKLSPGGPESFARSRYGTFGKRRWIFSHGRICSVLWVEELSRTTWIAKPSGTERSMGFKSFLNSVRRWDTLGSSGRIGADRFEGLDLGLLVDAEDARRLRWVETEPDDVADLVDELRVRRESEVLRPVASAGCSSSVLTITRSASVIFRC
jgi:hypothetical protein